MTLHANAGLNRFFETIVEQCQQAGLVWGEELYFDGTKVEANASLDSLKPRFFVEAHLADLFGAETEELPEETDQQPPPTEAGASRSVEQNETPLPTQLPASLQLRISLFAGGFRSVIAVCVCWC